LQPYFRHFFCFYDVDVRRLKNISVSLSGGSNSNSGLETANKFAATTAKPAHAGLILVGVGRLCPCSRDFNRQAGSELKLLKWWDIR